jgi:hypothetical protein
VDDLPLSKSECSILPIARRLSDRGFRVPALSLAALLSDLTEGAAFALPPRSHPFYVLVGAPVVVLCAHKRGAGGISLPSSGAHGRTGPGLSGSGLLPLASAPPRFIGAHASPLLRRAASRSRSICSLNPPIGNPNSACSSLVRSSFAPRFLRFFSFLRLSSHSLLL